MIKINKNKILKNIIKLLIIWAVIYFLLGIFLYINQDHLLFVPDKNTPTPPKELNIQDIYFQTSDNVKLHAWRINNNSNKTVIFFHWNGWNLGENEDHMYILKHLWVNAFAIDYRGYWKSNWKMTKDKDIYTDWESAFDYVNHDLWINTKDIIIRGHSLWWAVAIYTAQNKDIHWVILEWTFYDLYNAVKLNYRYMPTSLLLKHNFPNNIYIQNIKSKILFFHSKDDKMVGFDNVEKLYPLAPSTKELVVTYWWHNYWIIKNYDTYFYKIKEFLN